MINIHAWFGDVLRCAAPRMFTRRIGGDRIASCKILTIPLFLLRSSNLRGPRLGRRSRHAIILSHSPRGWYPPGMNGRSVATPMSTTLQWRPTVRGERKHPRRLGRGYRREALRKLYRRQPSISFIAEDKHSASHLLEASQSGYRENI